MQYAETAGADGEGRGSWRVLAVTSLGLFLAFLDITIVNVAFPDLERSFEDASRSGLSWVLSAYNIVFAALLVPAGRLADLVGRRRLYLYGLAGFVAASAACALAPSAETLVAARVLQAAGAALISPSSLALVLPEFPLGERAMAVGLVGAVAGLASGIGPSLGGLLIDLEGWRLVFLVNVPAGLLSFVVGSRVLRESRDPNRGAVPDPLGIAIITLAVGLLALGIVQGEDWGWSSVPVVASFAGGVVLALLFVARTLRHPRPAIELDLFRIRSFAVANAGTLLFAMAFFAGILSNVLFLTSVWDYSVLKAGLATTPGPLISAVVAGPAGRLADRYGQRLVTVPGAAIYAVGYGWYATRVGTEPQFLAQWLPGTIFTGIGIGLIFPALASAAVAAIPAERFATATAINATARQLGAALGIALLVAIVGTPAPADAPAAFDNGWWFSVGAGLVAGAACLALGRVRALAATLTPDRDAASTT